MKKAGKWWSKDQIWQTIIAFGVIIGIIGSCITVAEFPSFLSSILGTGNTHGNQTGGTPIPAFGSPQTGTAITSRNSSTLTPTPTSTPTSSSPSPTPVPTATQTPTSDYSAAQPGPGCDKDGGGRWTIKRLNKVQCVSGS